MAQSPAAISKSPVDISMDDKLKNDSVAETNNSAETKQTIEEMPQGGIEGVPFPDFPDVESTQAATEPQPTEVEIHGRSAFNTA